MHRSQQLKLWLGFDVRNFIGKGHRFYVVLMVQETSPVAETFDALSERHTRGEWAIFHLHCLEVFYSNPNHLIVVLDEQSKLPKARLSIPYQYVILIADSVPPQSIQGFSHQDQP